MGTVHRAVQLPMGRQVAVKLLHSELVRNPEMVSRFEREALAASTVDHPNAITIYDSGRADDGQVYIAMEYLEGESLSALLQRDRMLSPARALELWVPVVRAMVVAHRKGIIHRDLKPDNVFISKKATEEGAVEEVVKVLDFGIAKVLQGVQGVPGVRANAKTLAGTRLGTALYMSPEHLEGREAGKHSDVYALGLILIEMMTGRLPWGRSAEEADAVLTMMRLVTPPKPLDELCSGQTFSPELQLFFDEVLAIDPARRPQDAGELLKRVAQVPEAHFLDRTSGRRSDVSQMLSAAFINAATRRGAEGEPAPEPAAAAPPADPAGAGTVRPAEPPTQPLAAAKLVPPAPLVSSRQLGAMETLKTGVPEALLASGLSELPSLPTVVKGKEPLQSELTRPRAERPSSDRVKSAGDGGGSNERTLPQPRAAPQLDTAPPTQPLLLARLPVDKIRAQGRNASQPTLDMSPSSSNTMRTRRKGRRVYLIIGVIAVALLLALVGLLLLQSQSAPRSPAPPPPAPSPPVVGTAAPSAPAPAPPPAPVEPAPAEEAADSADPDKDRRGELQVAFHLRKQDRSAIACGSTELRPCDGVCAIAPGEQCVVRGGRGTRKFTYEDLQRRVRRGHARIDITL